jgi:hypothetical protein
MHTSLSLTLHWFLVSRHVSGITCPSSGGTTRTHNWWILCAVVDVGWAWDQHTSTTAHNSHQSYHTLLDCRRPGRRQSNKLGLQLWDRFLERPLLRVSRSFMNVANRVLWRMMIILKANKVNFFVSSVLFVFWYHSPNILDTPHICSISRLRVKHVEG